MDIDFEEVFGVEVPDEGGEPADEEAAGGEELEGAASGVPKDAGEAVGSEETAEPSDTEVSGVKTGRREEPSGAAAGLEGEPPEESARYVEVRRRAEEEAREKAARDLDAVIAGAGLSDPYTGSPITNSAELRAYRERFEQEKRREFQEGHGMDEQSYRAFVEELPEVRAAREAAEQLQAREVKARIQEDIREISKLDPSVKGLADLAKRPEYGQVCGLVEKGYRLSDAWKVTNFEALSQRAAEAARQETRNSLGGKQHLAATASRGEGAATVPPEVAEEYRQLMPDATDAEIQRHYDSYARQSGL